MAHRGSFLLRIKKSVEPVNNQTGEIKHIIVRRPHAHMADDLKRVYEDQKQVRVIVDRRYAERQQILDGSNIPVDRRVADRRNQIERKWKMNLIVKRPYAYLTDDLQRVFKGQADVNIIVDSRHAGNDRRRKDQAISEDRRLGDRRKGTDTLVDVVISC